MVALLSEALDALGSGPGGEPLRLDVMASLARALAWHGLDLPRARALAAQAVAAARAASDPLTLAGCLLAQHHAIWAAGTARDRLRIATEVAGLAERAGDRGDPARSAPAGRDRPARAGRSRLPRRTR